MCFTSEPLAVIPKRFDIETETAFVPLNSQTISESSYYAGDGVLSTQDILIGTVLAFVLAFGYSFLNGQSSSSSFVSWPSQSKNAKSDDDVSLQSNDVEDEYDDKIFNADNWKEMSREENYVLYNTKIRQQKSSTEENSRVKVNEKENKLVLLALLVLFVPIFSVEFFFALSRQFVCEMGMGGGDFVEKLCSPLVSR